MKRQGQLNRKFLWVVLIILLFANNSASSTTKSGISTAKVTITDEKKQIELTGKDAASTIADINTDVATGKDTTNALKPIYTDAKEKEINAGFDITGAFVRETGTFIENRAKEADAKKDQAENIEQKLKDPENKYSDAERQNLYDQAKTLRTEAEDIANKWAGGGTHRQIAMALAAAATGNVTGGLGESLKNGVVNYIQQLGSAGIGKLVKDNHLTEGDPLHALLHAVAGCAGAAASNQNCGAGAMGAASSSLLTNLFSKVDPKETQEQREAKRNIITTLVAGIATGTNLNAATATTAATANVDNNWLSSENIDAAKIVMMRWDGSQWISLETKHLGKDGNFVYYEAQTNSFSPFAIGGVKTVATPVVTTTAIAKAGASPTAIPLAAIPPTNLNWILIIVAVIIIIAGIYYFARLRRNREQ